jgi:hypothetical protein
MYFHVLTQLILLSFYIINNAAQLTGGNQKANDSIQDTVERKKITSCLEVEPIYVTD